VTAASSGKEAAEILARDPHRLVITDWEMPLMTGISVCVKPSAPERRMGTCMSFY